MRNTKGQKALQSVLGAVMNITYAIHGALPYEIRGLEKIPKDKPCIFVLNHSNSNDYPNVMKLLHDMAKVRKRRCANTLVASDSLNAVTKLVFGTTGAVLIDRNDRGSSAAGIDRLVEHIRNGSDAVFFAEGTWNLHPYEPMLILKRGFARAAMRTEAPIVPIVFEYIENHEVCKREADIYERLIIDICDPVTEIFSTDTELAGYVQSMMTDKRRLLWKENNVHLPALYGRPMTESEIEIYLNHTHLKKNHAIFKYDTGYELRFLVRGTCNEFVRGRSGRFEPLGINTVCQT